MTRTPNLPKSCHWQVEKRSQHDWSIWAVGLQIALMLVIYMVDSGFKAMTGVEIYASVAIWWTFLDRNPWQRIQWNQQNPQMPKDFYFSDFHSAGSSAPPGRCSLKGCPSSIPRWPGGIGNHWFSFQVLKRENFVDPQKHAFVKRFQKREDL